MVTIKQLQQIKNDIQIKEYELLRAKTLENELRTKYIEENAKFKSGQICDVVYDDITTKDNIKILCPFITDFGSINYYCEKDGLKLIFDERNLVLNEKYN